MANAFYPLSRQSHNIVHIRTADADVGNIDIEQCKKFRAAFWIEFCDAAFDHRAGAYPTALLDRDAIQLAECRQNGPALMGGGANSPGATISIAQTFAVISSADWAP